MTISFRSFADDSSGNQAKPAGVTDGDFLLWVAVADSASATITSPPTGFTPLANSPITSTLDGQRLVAYYRVASSEPANYNGWSSSGTFAATMLAWQTTNGPCALAGQSASPDGSAGTGSPAVASGPSIDVPVSNTVVVWVGGIDAGTAVSLNAVPSGMTQRNSRAVGSFLLVTIADVAQAASGATGNKDGTFLPNGGRGMAFLLAIKDGDSSAGSAISLSNLERRDGRGSFRGQY